MPQYNQRPAQISSILDIGSVVGDCIALILSRFSQHSPNIIQTMDVLYLVCALRNYTMHVIISGGSFCTKLTNSDIHSSANVSVLHHDVEVFFMGRWEAQWTFLERGICVVVLDIIL